MQNKIQHNIHGRPAEMYKTYRVGGIEFFAPEHKIIQRSFCILSLILLSFGFTYN